MTVVVPPAEPPTLEVKKLVGLLDVLFAKEVWNEAPPVKEPPCGLV